MLKEQKEKAKKEKAEDPATSSKSTTKKQKKEEDSKANSNSESTSSKSTKQQKLDCYHFDDTSIDRLWSANEISMGIFQVGIKSTGPTIVQKQHFCGACGENNLPSTQQFKQCAGCLFVVHDECGIGIGKKNNQEWVICECCLDDGEKKHLKAKLDDELDVVGLAMDEEEKQNVLDGIPSYPLEMVEEREWDEFFLGVIDALPDKLKEGRLEDIAIMKKEKHQYHERIRRIAEKKKQEEEEKQKKVNDIQKQDVDEKKKEQQDNPEQKQQQKTVHFQPEEEQQTKAPVEKKDSAVEQAAQTLATLQDQLAAQQKKCEDQGIEVPKKKNLKKGDFALLIEKIKRSKK